MLEGRTTTVRTRVVEPPLDPIGAAFGGGRVGSHPLERTKAVRRSPRILAACLAATSLLIVAAPTPAAAATTAALWHMDETSGQMLDASGSGNSGSLQNVTRVTPGFNGSGRAYSFNGSNSRVVIPNSPSLNPGSQDITISVHVKFASRPSGSVGDYDLVRKQKPNAVYKVEILGSGKAFCKFKGSGGNVAISAGPVLADNQWHTIVCRKTASQVTLTVDGSNFTKNGSAGSISSTIAVTLGAKPNSGDWYKGLMDEVSIITG